MQCIYYAPIYDKINDNNNDAESSNGHFRRHEISATRTV